VLDGVEKAGREGGPLQRRAADPWRHGVDISLTAAVLIFVALVDGVLVRYGMQVLDASYAEIDAFIDPDAPPPVDPMKPGSAASLVDWRALGRDGRRFVSNTPTAEEID
ncbi:MAG: alpha/beta-hydrolase N-terminal domain-containing protein, partial [Pseudomonadota bacterium]